MKLRKGNGTPHPRGRRSASQESHNFSDDIQLTHPQDGATKSSLENLLSVHTQVTQTLQQIDALVLRIHQLSSSSHVVPEEVQDFANALAGIDANLQDWTVFLEAAAERLPVLHLNREEEPCDRGSIGLTPIRDEKSADLCSEVDDLEYGAISYSPLVVAGVLEHESSCEPLMLTPLHRASSPLHQTPRMVSPPRSVQVLSTISESPLSSTPAFERSQETRPQDLVTPEGAACQMQLVFETPPAQTAHHVLMFPLTPKFGVSPPRTCRLMRPGEAIEAEIESTPVMPSPFRTPGFLLERKDATSGSSSADSPGIADDLTASTVKRLGPKGLEERLWQELAIRKADILQPIKQR